MWYVPILIFGDLVEVKRKTDVKTTIKSLKAVRRRFLGGILGGRTLQDYDRPDVIGSTMTKVKESKTTCKDEIFPRNIWLDGSDIFLQG